MLQRPYWLEPGETGEGSTIRRRASAVALALAIAGVFGLWVWEQGSEGRAIRQLSPADREVLYRSTLESLESVCSGDRESQLRGYCQRQAEFVLQFPECDEACRTLARSQLLQPVR